MISTESVLSQFHLANSSAGTNAHHYLSNDKKQHVLHKYSQSLDANSSYNTPYISISECYSETQNNKSIYKQQQPNINNLNLVQKSHQSNICSLDQDHLKSTLNFNNKLSVFNNKPFFNKATNCDSRVVLHTRSNSNIVLGSKKQYSPQQLNHLNLSSINSSANQKFHFHQMQDRSTNRHFKVYEKNELANTSLIANSTSLIDVSQTSLLKSSANGHQQQRSISSLRPWESNSLSEKFNNLSLNNNYLNQTRSQYAPPRPPKPVNLRINNQFNSNSVNLNNNHSFNELFSTILNSDEEYSPTASKHYGSFYQFNSNQQSCQRPKNSLSSSCSSNASPYYNQNTQDLVFTYDQNLTNQSFNHSTSRFNSFEDNDLDRSPTYLNNLKSNSNQTSPKLNSSLSMPPAINRELKPRKVVNDKLNKFSHLNNSNK